MIQDILQQNLTDVQYAAAIDNTDEVLCLACAGSGKSRTLAYRIARLIAEGTRLKVLLLSPLLKKLQNPLSDG